MGCSESAPDANGHITLDAKQAGKRSAGNPHAAFDEAGAGNVTSGAGFTGPYRRRASPRPYRWRRPVTCSIWICGKATGTPATAARTYYRE